MSWVIFKRENVIERPMDDPTLTKIMEFAGNLGWGIAFEPDAKVNGVKGFVVGNSEFIKRYCEQD